jgi:hypothetical protein
MNAAPGALDGTDGQSPAVVTKGICFSCAATRRGAVKQNLNPHESDLRCRALCLRPVVFLCMRSLQGRDDVDEVIPFAFIHFDLPCPSVRRCFGDHSICLSKFTLVCLKKADISAKVSTVQTGIRMRTRACDDGYRTVDVCERLSENVSREPLEIASGVVDAKRDSR